MFTQTKQLIAIGLIIVFLGPVTYANLGVAEDKKAETSSEDLVKILSEQDPKVRLDKIKPLLEGADQDARFSWLGEAGKAAFETGDLALAEKYAKEWLGLAPAYEPRRLRSKEGLDHWHRGGWNYGNAIHNGNMILGLVHLKRGKVDLAKSHLLSAGKTRGSPQLGSFGPSMRLAKELVVKGERETVLQYLDLCSIFWKSSLNYIDSWKKQINEGKTPDFLPNVLY